MAAGWVVLKIWEFQNACPKSFKNPFFEEECRFISSKNVICLKQEEKIEVTSQHGVIQGRVETTSMGKRVDTFLGIPFAVPPVGEKRFNPPEMYGKFPNGKLSQHEIK